MGIFHARAVEAGSEDLRTLGVHLVSCVALAGHTASLPLPPHLSRTVSGVYLLRDR